MSDHTRNTALIEQLKAILMERLGKKTRRAEQSFVNEQLARKTCNCRHRGRSLDAGRFSCKILAYGGNENHAGVCDDEKARVCPEFCPLQSEAEARSRFRSITEVELRLRWPSLGELHWLLQQIDDLLRSS